MITQLRMLHLGYAFALVVLLTLALVMTADSPEEQVERLPLIITAGVALGTLGTLLALRSRPPAFAAPDPIISVRTMAFLNVMFSMVPALVGLVAVFLGGGLPAFLMGFVVSLPLMLATVPTRRSVTRLVQAANPDDSGDGAWARLLEA